VSPAVRRRRRFREEGSLELLLDTMCNAFGGVMFIAMLLAVLSQFAQVRSRAQDDSESLRLRRLRTQRMELGSELRQLRAARQQQANLSKAFAQHPNRDVLPELLSLAKGNAAKEARKEALSKEVAKARDRLEAELARQEKLRGDLARIGGELPIARKTVKGRTRELRMPRLRRMWKVPYWMIVRWDRLYLLRTPAQPGWRKPANTDVVNFQKVGRVDEFEAIPGRGVDLKGNWKLSPEMEDILGRLRAENYGMFFAVYPDSYGTFIPLRDFFVGLGYSYNWVPWGEEKLRLSLQSGVSEQ